MGLLAAAGVAAAQGVATAQVLAPIVLPAPRSDFGRSLGQALRMRQSQRDFVSRPLPTQVLSELLWSAYGVNCPDTQDRTAPSWRHARETEIYAAMETGTWRYDPVAHRLLPHLAGDIRSQTGVQDFVAVAPLTLVYVSDATHMSGVSPAEQHRFAAADTGFIGQNVYLLKRLNCWRYLRQVRSGTDRLVLTLVADAVYPVRTDGGMSES